MKPLRGLAGIAALSSLLLPGRAGASAGEGLGRMVAAAPELDAKTGQLAVLVGAVKTDATAIRLKEVTLVVGGREIRSAGQETYEAWAKEAAGADPKWSPSAIVVGLVYQWTKDTPRAVLDGIGSLFRNLPPQLPVYAWAYGQGDRPPARKASAAEVGAGELDDFQPVPGDAIKLLDVVTLAARRLEEDEAPIKHLVLITDGRDHQSSGRPSQFTALGDAIKKRGIHLDLVSFSPPVDARQSAADLTALAAAAQTLHLRAEGGEEAPDLAIKIRALADAIAGEGLWRHRFDVPFGLRVFGGERALEISAVAYGVRRQKAGTLALPGWGGGFWVALIGVSVLLLAGAGIGARAYVMRRSQAAQAADDELSFDETDGVEAGGDGDDAAPADDELLEAVHELVRRGAPARRAVAELSRKFPAQVHAVRAIDPAALPAGEHPFLRTRPGQARLKEIQRLLAPAATASGLDPEIASVITQGVQGTTPPEQAAAQIRARVPEDVWSSFARAPLDELSALLGAAARTAPGLDRPRARSYAIGIQDALRTQDARSVVVGWLVRASGPGKRGETLRLQGGRTVLGRGTGRNIDLADDPGVAERHAEIRIEAGEFLIAALDGKVRVEGKDVHAPRPLVDGETIELGRGRFVFKAVRAG